MSGARRGRAAGPGPARRPAPSTEDLGLFFEPHHPALAAELDAKLGAEPAAEVAADLAAEVGDGSPAPGADPARLVGFLGKELGVLRFLVPAPGEELDLRALCLVRERLAYESPLWDALFAVQGLSAYSLWSEGGPAAKAVLAGAKHGDEILAFALTEPEAGSDAAALAARAEREPGGYRIRGEKTLISNAPIATHLVVFATVDPAARSRGITAFLVPAGAEGLEITPTRVTADHPIADVALRGVFVPDAARVGAEGAGFPLAMRALERLRVSVGAAAAGMARRALDEALAHTRSRRQFGAPLAENPVIQAQLAEMATELDAARLLVLRAARELDLGEARSPAAGAMAKLYATEAAHRVVDRAVQLCGGLGVTRGHVVENLYRAIRPLRIYEGTSEIQRLIIARHLEPPDGARGARGAG